MVPPPNNKNLNKAANPTFVTVPTKTYDGGSQGRMISEGEATSREIQDPKKRDPFLFYSNDSNRFSYLLYRSVELPQQQQMPVVRKTRISFEVYPDLLLDNLLINVNADAAAPAVRDQE
jgi:hypothetical protein